MPPDPVLVLISVVGFFAYIAIGGVVAGTALKVFPRLHGLATGRRKYDYPGELWFAIGAMSLLWPLILTLSLPIVLFVVGPWRLAKTVAIYTAKAQIREVA